MAVCHENERPLLGLVGQLDWIMRGQISTMLRHGFLTGKPGECTYLPTVRGKRVLHLLLVGGGMNPDPGSRAGLHKESLTALKRNLKSLGVEKMGVSLQDFGEHSEEFFEKEFKGISVCVVN